MLKIGESNLYYSGYFEEVIVVCDSCYSRCEKPVSHTVFTRLYHMSCIASDKPTFLTFIKILNIYLAKFSGETLKVISDQLHVYRVHL